MKIMTLGFDEVRRKQQFFQTEINRRGKINAAYSERQHWNTLVSMGSSGNRLLLFARLQRDSV